MKENLFVNGNQIITIDLSENDIDTCILYETHKGITSVVKRFIDYEFVENLIKEVKEVEREKVCDEMRNFIESKTCLGYIDEQKPNDFYEFIDQIEKGGKK